jgi:hypothetical protein
MSSTAAIAGARCFCGGADRLRFLDLVAELPDRFGLEVHAFVSPGFTDYS